MKLISFAKTHRIAAVIGLVALIGAAYWGYTTYAADSGETRYILGTVEKGTIVSSVSASGQVAASSQIELTAKATGDLVQLNAAAGQAVRAGALIASVDASDAAFELENARLSYQELTEVDASDLAKAKNDVADAHQDARTTLISLSSGLSDVLESIDALFDDYLGYESGRPKDETRYITTAEKSYQDALESVNEFQKEYRTLGSSPSDEKIEATLETAYANAKLVLDAAKDAKDAVVYLREGDNDGNANVKAEADEAYESVNGIVSDANEAVTNATAARNAIRDANEALADLTAGPDTLELRSEQLSVREKEEAYNDHFVRAPFDGVIASVPVKKGDSVSSGETVATLITKQMIAELSLNEVDAAKIAVGDKATLTFDALEELTLTGSVAEVDLVGTVSQGVVSYTVKIAFDAENDQVKPGMTVNASIITESRQDALMVPASALKTQNGESYVLAFQPELTETGGTSGVVAETAPRQIPVTIGISDDTNVEILSGLSEGMQIVVRTSTGAASTAAASGTNANRGGGGFGGPGGGIRF